MNSIGSERWLDLLVEELMVMVRIGLVFRPFTLHLRVVELSVQVPYINAILVCWLIRLCRK